MSKDIVELYRNNKDVCLELYDYLGMQLTEDARYELSMAMIRLMERAKEADND